jgi:DNA-directed RNA polymerase specialized sigma subunit
MEKSEFQTLHLDIEVNQTINAEPSKLIVKEIIYHDVASIVVFLKSLNETELMVLSLHYEQKLNIKEIAAVMGHCESSIQKILEETISKL